MGLFDLFKKRDSSENHPDSSNDISDLQDEIAKQIATYLPNYQNSEVECTNENGELHLKITVDDTVFSYTTSETPEEGEISLRPMA